MRGPESQSTQKTIVKTAWREAKMNDRDYHGAGNQSESTQQDKRSSIDYQVSEQPDLARK